MFPVTVEAIASLCGGEVEGDGARAITGVNSLEDASDGELSFVANRRAAVHAKSSRAGCLLVAADFDNPSRRTVVRVQDPRAAFARMISVLCPKSKSAPGIHSTAAIGKDTQIGDGCSIAANVTIGERTIVAANSVIAPGCVIGNDVAIGEHCVLHANVTVYDHVRIGSRVILHAGSVIGADGFGFAFTGERYEKFPQIGTVEIGDDVEVGANACIDRAALGVTRIGEGTKLDNMVHVAHNCQIGRHVVIAAQTGFSGAVAVGDYAVVGGQVGVGDKARIESQAVVGSGAGILTSKIVRAGEPVWGTPARPLQQHLQQLAALAKLPAVLEQVKELRRRIEELEKA
jgi:UDP-3-O-[3-hydroxymyristoyl] glucosamine N-acyltransferase